MSAEETRNIDHPLQTYQAESEEQPKHEKNTLTEADIEAAIVGEAVYDIGTKTTAVVLTLRNGFEVVGTSACVDPANYSSEVGAKYARKRAIDKIWELEGYALQSALKL